MKKLRILVAAVLALVFMCNCSTMAFAAQSDNDDSAVTYNVSGPSPSYTCMDLFGNTYSSVVFPTLDAAKAAFGSDRVYTSCSRFYGGIFFNCCTYYSDGTGLYFRVAY